VVVRRWVNNGNNIAAIKKKQQGKEDEERTRSLAQNSKRINKCVAGGQNGHIEAKKRPAKVRLKIQRSGSGGSFKSSLLSFRLVVPDSDSLNRVIVLSN
jgi:hypothetical protein